MKKVLLLFILCWTCATSAAQAQSEWRDEWDRTVKNAEGQTLVLAVHPFPGNIAAVQAFKKRFPKIRVELSQMPANQFVPRVITEQKSGIYAWDAWMGQVSNMAELLIPAGGLEKIDPYLILPDLKNPATWRAPQLLYASDRGAYIVTFSLPLENAVYGNKRVLGNIRIDLDDPASLFDPRLQGKIAIRSADRSGAGAVTLAALMKDWGAQGPDKIRRLLTQPGTILMDNPRQITNAVMRGGKAVALGGAIEIISQCKLAGGCRDVVVLGYAKMLLPRGVAVLRNAPHKAAAKVWVNWLLSKEGQSVYVRATGETMISGAVSMRKDVPPAKGHEHSLPEYTQSHRWLLIGNRASERYVNDVIKLYRQMKAR